MPLSIKQALEMERELRPTSDSPLLDTEILLSFAVSQTREHLRANGAIFLTSDQEKKFMQLFNRRTFGEPVAYIVGKRAFWDFELLVNSSDLIPRPETEHLVELALELVTSRQEPIRIADLGTGSGAIAIAIARANEEWEIHAIEISESSLQVARLNAHNLGLRNIEFHMGSWCDGLPEKRFDLIVANPPYIKSGDSHLLKGDLPYEPLIALVAEELGYSALNEIIDQAHQYLKKDAWLLIEHGYEQQETLINRLMDVGYVDAVGHKDFSGVNRVVLARWNS